MKDTRSRSLLLIWPLALLLVWCGLGTAFAADDGEPVLLRIAVDPERPLRYVHSLEGELHLDLPEFVAALLPVDLETPITFRIDTGLGASVAEAGEGQATLRVGVEYVSLVAGGLGYEVAFSARRTEESRERIITDPDDVPLMDLFFDSELVELAVDELGNLTSLDVPAAFTGDEMRPGLQSIIGSLSELLPRILPEEPIRTGHTWGVPLTMTTEEEGVAAEGTLRFAFLGVRPTTGRRCAEIGMRGTIRVARFSLAEALGARGVYIEHGSQITPAIEEGLALDTVTFIHVPIRSRRASTCGSPLTFGSWMAGRRAGRPFPVPLSS